MTCLIRPPAVESFRISTGSISLPLGLAYIAGALEAHGQDVCVIDAVGEAPKKRTKCYKGFLVGLTPEEVVARVPVGTDVIGISVIFTHEWPIVVRLISLLREAGHDGKVIVGGEHVTSMPEFCLATSQADVVVLGEGEETIVEVVDALSSGSDLADVPGIGYRDGGQIVVNPRRQRRLNVDDIPRPAWDHFKIATYHTNGFIGGMETDKITMPILATRGCPYQCTYCSSPNMWTTRWLPRNPKKVLDEIEDYMRAYGARNFPFQDLTAIIKKEWIVEFCEEIIRRKLDIDWQLPSGTRSEAIDLEVASLLKTSGMVSMAYAPESGSELTRRLVKKQMKTERLMKSIEAARDAGLNVTCFLIIGFPHDSSESIAENLEFIDKIVDAGVNELGINFYMALPGTELFNSLQDAGRVALDRPYFCHILDALALWPSKVYCETMTRMRLSYWKFRLFFRFYGSRKRGQSETGLMGSIAHALKGLVLRKHSSKLQTAIRHAFKNALDEIRVRFKRRWMSRREERKLFQDWPDIAQRIRKIKLAEGVAVPVPADTNEIHKKNVVFSLRPEHETQRAIAIKELGVVSAPDGAHA